MPDFVKWFEGKKHMWDGKEYGSSQEAQSVQAGYAADGFEVQVVPEGGKFLVYSRRVAAEQAAT
ncbi:MAG: hypothetical protein HY748_06490 [Elusimicrobia bacterium]|nr:hypothetical protein [Elusimicrobiota bacterium]